MRKTTLKELEWLHDCELLNLCYEVADPDCKSLALTVECPGDLGYPLWDGAVLVVRAINVAVSQHFFFDVSGVDSVDAISPGVSASLIEKIIDAKEMGIRFPAMELTIGFSSGSVIELICEAVEVGI